MQSRLLEDADFARVECPTVKFVILKLERFRFTYRHRECVQVAFS